METNQKDQQEPITVVTEWLKDALGPGADFSGLKVEAVADGEFYFCYLKDAKAEGIDSGFSGDLTKRVS